MPKYSLIILWLAVLFISCNSEKDTLTYELKVSGQVSLPLNQSTAHHTLALKHFDDGQQEYLFWANIPRNSILIYSLSKQKLIKDLVFERIGPNAIKRISGFSVLDLNNIIVDANMPGKLIRIDSSGAIHSYLTFGGNEGKSLNNIANIASSYSNNAYPLKDNYLIVPTRLPYFNPPPPADELRDYPVFAQLNLEDHSFQALPAYLPDDYFSNGIVPFFKTSCSDGKSVYFSFEASHKVFKTSDFKTFNNAKVMSRIAPNKFEGLDMTDLQSNPFMPFVEKFRYRNLYYDPYRDLFYRTAILPNKEEVFDPQKEFEYPSNFSIIVFDKNLNVLGETIFRNKKLSMTNMFVGRDGLYISTARPDNPDLKEDQISFEIFTF